MASDEACDNVAVVLRTTSFASSDRRGRFVLQRVPPGKHKLVARTRAGAEAKAEIAVPGAVLDLTVAPAKRGTKKGG